MVAGWHARRPVLPLAVAALAGAWVGWLARSRVRSTGVDASRPAPTEGAGRAAPTGGADRAAATEGAGRVAQAKAGAAEGPAPTVEPLPEEAVVDAPYTAEEPYTGRPRYGLAARSSAHRGPRGMSP